MRLIDADAWLKEHCEGCKYKRSGICSEEDPVCGSVELMYEAPTIYAVEVVRCKDCKHRPVWRSCQGKREDDFCSYGERKENG